MKRYVCPVAFILVSACAWAGRAHALPVSGRVVEKDKPVELVLEPGLHVTGRTADANGAPIPAADERGRFRITRICQGPLRLQANFDASSGGSSSVDAEAGQQDIRIILPWLILTDRSHVVAAQGFGLEDLNKGLLPAGEK